MIDRRAPRVRPAGNPVGTQSWRHLLFAHWPVDVQELRERVPRALELDLFEGEAYVGVVPFEMCNVRSRFWPGRLVPDFGETNVRTYVLHEGRPGVYFFSLDASSTLAVWGARWGWGLPYHAARILTWGVPPHETAHYEVHRTGSRASLELAYQVDLAAPLPAPSSREGALADFLLERYRLFVANGNEVQVGTVHHVPYRWHHAQLTSFHETLLEAAGIHRPPSLPPLLHWSPGVDVEIFCLHRSH